MMPTMPHMQRMPPRMPQMQRMPPPLMMPKIPQMQRVPPKPMLMRLKMPPHLLQRRIEEPDQKEYGRNRQQDEGFRKGKGKKIRSIVIDFDSPSSNKKNVATVYYQFLIYAVYSAIVQCDLAVWYVLVQCDLKLMRSFQCDIVLVYTCLVHQHQNQQKYKHQKYQQQEQQESAQEWYNFRGQYHQVQPSAQCHDLQQQQQQQVLV